MIRRGEIVDAKTLVAMLYVEAEIRPVGVDHLSRL